MEANVVWLAVILIVFQVGDAIAAGIPIAYIKNDLDRLGCSASLQRIIPLVKAASAAGLIVGLWVPAIGALTAFCLVVYFLVALRFHARAKDTVAQYIPAIAVGTFCLIVGIVSYLSAV